MFTGSLVALITPFKNGSVDEKGFEKFVAWQIKEGTDGLVPCGTTGESPTLSNDEHKRVIDICIERRQGHRRAGDRRHRLELDRRGDRPHPARQEGRRRRRHAGRALLQQADPGRPVPAFQGGGRGGRHPDPALQRAAAAPAATCRSTPSCGSRQVREHHRHQGRELRHGAARRSPSSGQEGLPAALGRGCERRGLPGAGRRRLHLGDRQHRAAAVRRHARRLEEARPRQGVRDPGPADAAAQGAVRRDQPRAGEIRRRAAGPVRAPSSACRWSNAPTPPRSRCATPWSMPG